MNSINSQIDMKNAIRNYLNKKIQAAKKQNAAVRGTYSDGKVTIGNKQYNAAFAVEMLLQDGLNVWCVINDTEDTAVIVGR